MGCFNKNIVRNYSDICRHVVGTLTENRMTVVEGWFAGKQWPRPPTLEELPEAARHPIAANIAINSKVCFSSDVGICSSMWWQAALGALGVTFC